MISIKFVLISVHVQEDLRLGVSERGVERVGTGERAPVLAILRLLEQLDSLDEAVLFLHLCLEGVHRVILSHKEPGVTLLGQLHFNSGHLHQVLGLD